MVRRQSARAANRELLYYSLIMAVFFIFGGWIGSKLTFNTPVYIVQLIFGVFMLYASIKMIISGIQHYIK